MAKPVINYAPVPMQNRALGRTIFVPMVVDRGQTVPMETVIERAIDRGLIVGIKPTAASSIAQGLGKQMYAELKNGRGIKFGDYFYGRLYLSGTCGSDGRLNDAKNDISVRLIPGKGYQVKLSDYTFQNVENELVPSVDFVLSDTPSAVRNKPVAGATLFVNGQKLVGEGTTTAVEFWATDSTGEITGDTPAYTFSEFTAEGASLLAFALSNVNAGNYVLKVVRTAAGGTRTESVPLNVEVVAA